MITFSASNERDIADLWQKRQREGRWFPEVINIIVRGRDVDWMWSVKKRDMLILVINSTNVSKSILQTMKH